MVHQMVVMMVVHWVALWAKKLADLKESWMVVMLARHLESLKVENLERLMVAMSEDHFQAIQKFRIEEEAIHTTKLLCTQKKRSLHLLCGVKMENQTVLNKPVVENFCVFVFLGFPIDIMK